MGRHQVSSGNPELKSVWVTDNFTGGTNITFADDTVRDNEFRQLINFDLDSRGSLEKRKGFSLNKTLTDLLFGFREVRETPLGDNNYKLLLFKLIDNTNSSWTVLSNVPTIEEYKRLQLTDNVLKVMYITQLAYNPQNAEAYIVTFNIFKDDRPTTCKVDKFIIDDPFTTPPYLTNIRYGEDFDKIYFTGNTKGMYIFDKKQNKFSKIMPSDTPNNNAYKPTAIEVRKVGFNVLGNQPLSWIASSGILTETIQGIYITTRQRVPVLKIPATSAFQINILHTGNKHDFTIEFKDVTKIETESKISSVVTKNQELSIGDLAVYDVELKSLPANELEIMIKFTGSEDTIQPYRDYYEVGTIDRNAKPVEQLNVGEYKLIEMGQRLVYYKGNTVWFSEINQYDYIPNYNYVPIPISDTDEIVRIAFFRTNYIIFTKESIWKFTGTFGSNDFGLHQVSDKIGCYAPESVVTVGGLMVFLSPTGLKAIKLDSFRENLENIKSMDAKIKPFIINSQYGTGFLYNDQYVLMNNYLGYTPVEVYISYQKYKVPDICRYYNDMDAYTFDDMPKSPNLIFQDNGQMYSFNTNQHGEKGVFRYGDNYGDFGETTPTVIETVGVNMGYPLHFKKIKNITLKVIGGHISNPLYVTVMADGTVKHDYIMQPVEVLDSGEVIYEEVINPTTVIPPSVFILGKSLLDQSKMGHAPIVTKKLKLPVKCKNISIRIKSNEDTRFTVLSIGYTFKLGKVKE